jgi:AcrR family transcriptional regulator
VPTHRPVAPDVVLDDPGTGTAAATGTGPERAGPGRPRRFEADEELRRLFDAAFAVVARAGYEDVTVADILAEAGMATRSFYRHFASKDDLLNAMFRRDARRFAASVTRRVADAPGPWEALVVWVDEILALSLDEPRAQRAAVLGSPAAMRSLAPGELHRAHDLLVAPLTATLVAGRSGGVFAGIRPEADAPLVSAATWETLTRARDAAERADADRLRADLLSFLRRALSVTGD